MGLLELTALLLVIGSVGQYLFGLAVYVEKKLVMVRDTKFVIPLHILYALALTPE